MDAVNAKNKNFFWKIVAVEWPFDLMLSDGLNCFGIGPNVLLERLLAHLPFSSHIFFCTVLFPPIQSHEKKFDVGVSNTAFMPNI
jgi:hypothetical protein